MAFIKCVCVCVCDWHNNQTYEQILAHAETQSDQTEDLHDIPQRPKQSRSMRYVSFSKLITHFTHPFYVHDRNDKEANKHENKTINKWCDNGRQTLYRHTIVCFWRWNRLNFIFDRYVCIRYLAFLCAFSIAVSHIFIKAGKPQRKAYFWASTNATTGRRF